MAIPGNFLSAASESMDPDITGWRARENCTTSRGTGGRNGDGCLTLTATAAGEMQAETTAAYPVVVGTRYFVFADAASATQPEQIGIEWLDDTYTPVGDMTWSLTTSSASAAWHRVSIAGVAPAGATQARVVLSVPSAASAALEYFENVYLGPPIQTAGNLFSFTTESFEVDLSGWGAEANCTLTRVAPSVQWPVDFYTAGGHVMALIATAGGDCSALTVERPAVTPGVDYRAECYLNPPTTGSALWIELRFYDVNGTQLDAVRSVLAPASTGLMRQRASKPAPAGSASCAVAVGMTGATAGQAMGVETVVVIDATDVFQDSSVVPYEDASFEQGIGSWTVDSGTATIAQSTPWGAAAYDGAYSLTVSSSSTSTNKIVSRQYPIGPGSWKAEVNVKNTAGAWDVAIDIRWYDASGTSISVTTPALSSVPADGGWWDVFIQTTTPDGAATARIEAIANATAASSTLQIDKAGLYPHQPDFSVNSDSTLGVVSIVLRELVIGEMIRLYRIVGSSQTLVRGPDGWINDTVLTSNQYIVEDYEAPIGVPFSYRAEFYKTNGVSAGWTLSGEADELTLPDPSDCWIKDVLQPERNTLLRASVAPDWSRPIEQTEYRIRRRRNSVVLSDVRGGLTGTLQVWTMDDDERQALHFALDTSSPLLLQFAPEVGLEDAYYAIGDITENRVSPVGSEPRRLWSLTLTQVDAPIGGVSGTAGWTVQDVLSTYSTAQDVFNTYMTVLDLALDQREG